LLSIRKAADFPENDQRRDFGMKNNNQIKVPQALEAGSVGGRMVKNMYPGRIAKCDRNSRTAMGHVHKMEYIAALTV
jgi:hypothetical protein